MSSADGSHIIGLVAAVCFATELFKILQLQGHQLVVWFSTTSVLDGNTFGQVCSMAIGLSCARGAGDVWLVFMSRARACARESHHISLARGACARMRQHISLA